MTTETAQIIQFADAQRPKRKFHGSSMLPCAPAPRDEEGLTETAKNLRLRQARYEAWREADALREYWRASQKMHDAVYRVQNQGLIEGNSHPVIDPKDRWTIVAKWRAAIVRQLLTPAPTMREIVWKRAVFKHSDHTHIGVNPERIEQAIADDVEFLKSHPTRRKDLQQ